jgi:hypothetical protein
MSSRLRLTDRAASVLDADPRLARELYDDDALAVGRAPLLPLLELAAGPWEVPPREALGERACVLAVLDGLLLRDGAVVGGPGDLLDPWAQTGDWLACTPVRLAVVGADFADALAPWPEAARLAGRPRERALRLRTGESLLDVLWRLAGRWARPATDGLALPAVLDGAPLACLARMPEADMQAALAGLEERGAVARGTDRAWVLLWPAADSPPRERLRAKVVEQCMRARLTQADTAALFVQGGGFLRGPST